MDHKDWMFPIEEIRCIYKDIGKWFCQANTYGDGDYFHFAVKSMDVAKAPLSIMQIDNNEAYMKFGHNPMKTKFAWCKVQDDDLECVWGHNPYAYAYDSKGNSTNDEDGFPILSEEAFSRFLKYSYDEKLDHPK